MSIKFIADCCSNHNADWTRTARLVQTAKRIGCVGVKFQLFDESLYAPQFTKQREMLRKRALPEGFIIELHKLCKDEGIEFHCTPFSLEAVDKLAPWVDGLKIGSYEILWLDLIRKCAATGLPLGISLGNVADDGWDEKEAMDISMDAPQRTIYYCSSHYPANPKTCRLDYFKTFAIQHTSPTYTAGKTTPLTFIGYSDHTCSPGVIYRAVMEGAECIEFHLSLDDLGWEYEHGHCWLPNEIHEVIQNVRIGEAAVSGERSDDSEIRKWRTDPSDGMRPLAQYRKELNSA